MAGLAFEVLDVMFSYCIGLLHEFDVVSEDRATRERAVAYLQQIAEAIGETGAGILISDTKTLPLLAFGPIFELSTLPPYHTSV